jgi:glycosyltransferase involved in cell wall biosynthesis
MSTVAHRVGRTRLAVLVRVWPKLSETFILEEVLALERRGIEVSIVGLAAAAETLRHSDVERVQAPVALVPPTQPSALAAHLAAHATIMVTHPVRWCTALLEAHRRGASGRRDFARAAWLARHLISEGAARLHVHFIAETADLAQLAALMAGVPWSISAHAKDIYLSAPDDLRRRLLAADFTVTCTEFNRATLAAIAPNAKVERMYHGIDAARFRHDVEPVPSEAAGASRDSSVAAASPRGDTAPHRLLAVGRLRAKKGFDGLIDACALLVSRGRHIQCDIVGYGELRDALQSRIEAAGLAGIVRLVGKLERDGIVQSYRHCNVFVQPSRITADGDRDGIPNVMLEAMSMARAVVATRVSGIPEVLEHEVNGLLVEADDASAMASAIERLLDDEDLATRLGARARHTIQRDFDNDTNLALLMHLMEADHACGDACVA